MAHSLHRPKKALQPTYSQRLLAVSCSFYDYFSSCNQAHSLRSQSHQSFRFVFQINLNYPQPETLHQDTTDTNDSNEPTQILALLFDYFYPFAASPCLLPYFLFCFIHYYWRRRTGAASLGQKLQVDMVDVCNNYTTIKQGAEVGWGKRFAVCV